MARGKMDWTLDVSEVETLEADLRKAPGRAQRGLPKALMRGAAVIDREMTIDATGHMGNWFGIKGTEYVIPLEQHVSHELIAWNIAEIGIEDKGAGRLGHIIAYGSVKNDPAYDPHAGPRRAMPEVLDHMADLGENSVFGPRRGSLSGAIVGPGEVL